MTGYGRCLDGSWPVYYFAYGAQPTKWVIELEGGDWCTRFDRGDDSRERSKDERRNCFDRRELGGLQGGTTKEDPEYLDIKEMGDQAAHLSSNSNRNPMMHDWNKVGTGRGLRFGARPGRLCSCAYVGSSITCETYSMVSASWLSCCQSGQRAFAMP